MKKFITHNPLLMSIIGLAVLATIVWATEWQDYSALSGEPASGDDLLIRDVSATPPADGTLKRLPWSDLKTYVANGANYWTGSQQTYLTSEIVVNDEASLYSALDGVDRFLEQNDPDPEFGVNDTTKGYLYLYGDNDVSGALQRWYNSAGEDTDEQYWQVEANGADYNLGPTSDPDMFKFGNNGSLNPSDSPTYTGWHDIDDEGVWSIGAVDADVNTATGDTTSRWKTLQGNSLVDYLIANGTDEELQTSKVIDSSAGIEATYFDGGTPVEANSDDPYDLQTNYPNVCSYVFVSGNVAATKNWTLPDSGICDTSPSDGSMKNFIFINNDSDHDLVLDPGDSGTNYFQVFGSQTEDCDPGEDLYIDYKGAVQVFGRTADVWYIYPLSGTDVLCGSSP